jgi:hypothetical protein
VIGAVRRWARRAASLHDELAAVVAVDRRDPRWWLLAGGVAVAEQWDRPSPYVRSDAEPSADTFIGHAAPPPADPVGDAIARAHAARAALRDLDGALPDQPLAVTIRRGAAGATMEASALDRAAFAIGARCFVAPLAARVEDEDALARELRVGLAGGEPELPVDDTPPFVTVSLGADTIEMARHAHRRGWSDDRGPWLGVGRTATLATVSTCHMVVDGFGHAWLAARIAEHARAMSAPRAPSSPAVPSPIAVDGAVPLGIAWRELRAPAPRALPLAYEMGVLLHRMAGDRNAMFSPVFQIPVAAGRADDPQRRRHRAVPAIASVCFVGGEPEPYVAFEARTRPRLSREAEGHGLMSRMLAAARAAPTPLAWKRRAVGTARPRWLGALASLLGGRACLSRIRVDAPMAPSCAVSAPGMHASPDDAFGGFVVTIIDDGERAAITVCGSGRVGTHAAAAEVADELVAACSRERADQHAS